MGRQRRVKGEGSIYQRGDGRWTYTVDLGWINGRRVRRSVTATTRKGLQPKINALKAKLEAGGIGSDSTTVAAWLTYWLDEIAVHTVRPRTLTGYRGYVKTWLIPHLGQHRLGALAAEHVRILYSQMEKAGKSTATIRQAHAILSRALSIAVDEGKIPRNPCATVTPPKPTAKGSHGKLTSAEARAVLHFLVDDPRQARWYVAILAALRQGEALGLAWSDVHLAAGYIDVRNALQRLDGKLTITDVKSQSSHRRVPLLPEVALALELHGQRTGTDGLVFGPRDNKADWSEWQAVLAGAGVAARPPHAARATTASLLTEAGVPSKIIAEILGHSTPQITEAAYIHGDAVMHRDALERAGALVLAEPRTLIGD